MIWLKKKSLNVASTLEFETKNKWPLSKPIKDNVKISGFAYITDFYL